MNNGEKKAPKMKVPDGTYVFQDGHKLVVEGGGAAEVYSFGADFCRFTVDEVGEMVKDGRLVKIA